MKYFQNFTQLSLAQILTGTPVTVLEPAKVEGVVEAFGNGVTLPSGNVFVPKFDDTEATTGRRTQLLADEFPGDVSANINLYIKNATGEWVADATGRTNTIFYAGQLWWPVNEIAFQPDTDYVIQSWTMSGNDNLNILTTNGVTVPYARFLGLNQDVPEPQLPIVQPVQLGDGTRTSFSSPHSDNSPASSFLVNIDGFLQIPTESYTAAPGQITFSEAPPAGAEVSITFYRPVSPGELPGTDVSESLVVARGSITARTAADRFSDIVNVKDFGGNGGDDITDIVEMCFDNGWELLLPPTTLDAPYRITRSIRMPLLARIRGTVASRVLSGNVEGNGIYDDTEQAYVRMENDAELWAGDTPGGLDRSAIQMHNIVFLGSATETYGARPASANRTGKCFRGAIGGYSTNLFFQGFDIAFDNPWGYFLDLKRTGTVACNIGYLMDDFNASSIDTFYADHCTIAISCGKDPQGGSLRDVSVNMRPESLIALRVSDQIKIDGFCYIEGFGSGGPLSTGIQVVVDSGSKGKPLDISNVQFQLNDHDYMMTIDYVDDGASTPQVQAGRVSNCRFYDARIQKVGFGIHNDFDGNPTTPMAVIKDFDVESCSGIDHNDLLAQSDSPYKEYANYPYYSYLNDTTTTDWSSSSILPAVMDESAADRVESNTSNNIVGNRYQISRPGVYHITYDLTVRNETASELRYAQYFLRVLRAGTSTDVTLAKTYDTMDPEFTSSNRKSNVSLSTIVELNVGDRISIQARDSGILEVLNMSLMFVKR